MKGFFAAIGRALARFRWAYLLFSVLLSAAGALFLAFPEQAGTWVGRTIGAMVLVCALFFAVRLLAIRLRGVTFFFSMLFTVLAGVAGAYLLFAPDAALAYFSAAAGVYAIMDGSFKLQTAVSARRYKMPSWWVITVLGGLSVALGVWLLRFMPDGARNLALLMGAALLLGGILNLLSLWLLPRIAAHVRQDPENTTVIVVNPNGVAEDAPGADPMPAKVEGQRDGRDADREAPGVSDPFPAVNLDGDAHDTTWEEKAPVTPPRREVPEKNPPMRGRGEWRESGRDADNAQSPAHPADGETPAPASTPDDGMPGGVCRENEETPAGNPTQDIPKW